MSSVVANVKTLPLVSWKSVPVITTELLAQVYEVQEKQIWQNFSNNKSRFTEGKHYFKLTGSKLREFKNYIENFEAVRVASRTPNLMLWTERGTVRHAKMLGTDKAWDVQEALEEFYFSRKVAGEEEKPETKATQVTAIEYIKLIKEDLPNLGRTSLQQLYSDASEVDLGRRLLPLPKIEEEFFTATTLAEEFGVTPQKIGKVANAGGLKTEEFGEYRLSKSKYSSKQVEQFYYNNKGRQALALLLAETGKAN